MTRQPGRVAASAAMGSILALVPLVWGCSDGSSRAPLAPAPDRESPPDPITDPDIRARVTGRSIAFEWQWPTAAVALRVTREDAAQGSGEPMAWGLLRTQSSFEDRVPSPGRYRYEFTFTGGGGSRVGGTGFPVSLVDERIELETPVLAVARALTTAVGDIDGDGWLDVAGATRLRGGSGLRFGAASPGLEPIWQAREMRDARLVDLDLDGDLDVVTNTYEPAVPGGARAQLFWNDGGTFRLDEDFDALRIGGFGETILTFDIDNDGDIDVFLPYYAHLSPTEHCRLLRNDGRKGFVDVTAEAGVAIAQQPFELRVEGAHAADLNDDGLIDFLVGSHLFMNQGDGSFVDRRQASGLPLRFDEGLKFIDWDLDGDLDVLLLDPSRGLVLYERIDRAGSGQPSTPRYRELEGVFPALAYRERFGMNTADLNGDGSEDIVLSSGADLVSAILVRGLRGYELASSPLGDLVGSRTDVCAFGDFDRDGAIDLVRRIDGRVYVQRNATDRRDASAFRVLVTGPGGVHDQQGRVVRLVPRDVPGVVITRVVDGGSGYLAQSDYQMVITSPFDVVHDLVVRFADRFVIAECRAGDVIEVRSDGFVRVGHEQPPIGVEEGAPGIGGVDGPR